MISSTNELEKLVEMAESVSARIFEIESIRRRLLGRTLLGFTVAYFGFVGAIYIGDKGILFSVGIYNTIIAIMLFLIAIAAFLYLFNCYIEFKDLKRTRRIERNILSSLLEMIFEYRSHISKGETSIVESTILDMRLQRIKFSAKESL